MSDTATVCAHPPRWIAHHRILLLLPGQAVHDGRRISI
jgi:hypothetical protein